MKTHKKLDTAEIERSNRKINRIAENYWKNREIKESKDEQSHSNEA